MDSSVVLRPDGPVWTWWRTRNLKRGDLVLLGRSEDGREGIYRARQRLCGGWGRVGGSRSCSARGAAARPAYARDYDQLMELLRYERRARQHRLGDGPGLRLRRGRAPGHAGPGRKRLLSTACMAGNALATHDLEGALSAHRAGTGHLHPDSPCQTATTTIWTCSTGCAAAARSPQFIEDYKHRQRHHVRAA